MNKVLIITESRWLPGLMAVFCAVFAVGVYISDIQSGWQAVIVACTTASLLYLVYRTMFPLWVLEITNQKLRVRNLYSLRKVVEFERAGIVSAGVGARWFGPFHGSDGVGFQNELVVCIGGNKTAIPLPFLSISAKQLRKLLRDEFGESQTTENQPIDKGT